MGEWRRVKIGDLCQIIKGETGLASALPGEYPLVATGADRRSCATWQFDTDAVCIPLVSSTGHGKKTLNYVHYQSGKFALGTILAAVIPKNPSVLTARFLHLYLSHFKDTVLVPLMKGAANVSLPMKEIASVEIPVPPLVEQQNLIDLIFRIENEHGELLAETNRQGDLLKQLRQAVLQEAVEGKLTVEWRKQHPVVKGDPQYDAAALLKFIETHWKSNKQKYKGLSLRGLNSGQVVEPYDSWVKTNIDSIGIVKVGSTPDRTNQSYWNGDINWVSSGEVANNSISTTKERITNKALDATSLYICPKGTVLLAMIGQGKTRGQTAILNIEAATNQNVAAVIIDHGCILPEFLWYFFLSQYMQTRSVATGGNQAALNSAKVGSFSLPLPPLAEQQAIVARVDSLMAFIDELEKQVAERKEQAQLLMQTVLREAFDSDSVAQQSILND